MIRSMRAKSRNAVTVGLEYAGHRWLESDVMPAIEPRVISAFRVMWPGHFYQDPPDQHYFWVVDYFFSPDVKFRAEGHGRPWVDRKAYVAYLHRPNTSYRHDMRHLDAVSHSCYISIRGGERFELEKLVPSGQDHAVFLDPGNVLGKQLLAMTDVGEKYRLEGFLKVQSMLCETVDMLFASRKVSAGVYEIVQDVQGAHSMVAAVRDYYDQHMRERITLSAVATKLGMSVSVLGHRYKQETGETPMQTLVRLRIRKTKELLIAGRSVKEASEQTGFYDPFHLSKTFKRLERVSPREFLHNIRNLHKP